MDNRTNEEKIVDTVTEMFTQRGYTEITRDSSNNVFAIDTDNKKICCFCTPAPKLSIAIVKKLIEKLQHTNCFHGILVAHEKPAYKAKEAIKNSISLGIYLEFFLSDELLINITKHSYVPHHSLTEQNESLRIKKEYGKHLPYILQSDAMCRFYDFQKGSVIKIIRRNDIVAYRLVV
jgi:DNA-directed RNA polymerase subunit H (RpoH/RPB5)